MTTEQIEELKRHSQMLGRIGAWVGDFCDDEESTTEEAVIKLVAKCYAAKANEAYSILERIQKERQQTNDN